jgi:hypothetical protein
MDLTELELVHRIVVEYPLVVPIAALGGGRDNDDDRRVALSAARKSFALIRGRRQAGMW